MQSIQNWNNKLRSSDNSETEVAYGGLSIDTDLDDFESPWTA